MEPIEARALLPAVGDKLHKIPELGFDQIPHNRREQRPQPCVVTFVHPRHLWYQMTFTPEGGEPYRECFKVPEVRT